MSAAGAVDRLGGAAAAGSGRGGAAGGGGGPALDDAAHAGRDKVEVLAHRGLGGAAVLIEEHLEWKSQVLDEGLGVPLPTRADSDDVCAGLVQLQFLQAPAGRRRLFADDNRPIITPQNSTMSDIYLG